MKIKQTERIRNFRFGVLGMSFIFILLNIYVLYELSVFYANHGLLVSYMDLAFSTPLGFLIGIAGIMFFFASDYMESFNKNSGRAFWLYTCVFFVMIFSIFFMKSLG